MKTIFKFVPVALVILLFAACEAKKTEPKTSTENNEPKAAAESPAIATGEPKAEPAPKAVVNVSEEIKKIVSKYQEDQNAFMSASRKATTTEERNQIRKDKSPDTEKVASELLAIVDENPDNPDSFEALTWVATNVRQGEMNDTAMGLLFDKYVEREEMKDLCASLAAGLPSQKVETRLRTLIEKSPHNNVKGIATYTLASYLARLPDMVDFADDPRAAKALGDEGVAYLKGFVQNDQEVETLFDSVEKDYPDVEGPRGMSLGKLAEKALFALRYLAIGKVAPDIEGEDVDGESFKLSEYRGKVVMLDFWGDW